MTKVVLLKKLRDGIAELRQQDEAQQQRELQSARGPAGAELLRRLEGGELTAEQEEIVRRQLGLPVDFAPPERAPVSTVSVEAAAAADGADECSFPERPLQSSYLVPDD